MKPHLAGTHPDPARAIALFEESLVLFRQVGDKAFIAGTLFNLASVAADNIASTRRVEEGLALAEAMGWTRGIAWGRDVLRSIAGTQCGPASAADRAGDGPSVRLTRREHEVVTLIACGRTNRQIARTLEIAGRTVDAHVRNILRKLGFTSRMQVAAWAAEQGPGGERGHSHPTAAAYDSAAHARATESGPPDVGTPS